MEAACSEAPSARFWLEEDTCPAAATSSEPVRSRSTTRLIGRVREREKNKKGRPQSGRGSGKSGKSFNH